MSKSSLKNTGAVENFNKPIDISLPVRKNPFSLRKDWIFENLQEDAFLETIYEEAKIILFNAATAYETRTGKQKVSLFKNRRFDYEYLRIEIDNALI